MEVVLQPVPRQRFDEQPRSVRREPAADVGGGGDRVTHVVEGVEDADEVIGPTAEAVGRGDLEAHAIAEPGVGGTPAGGGDRLLVVVEAGHLGVGERCGELDRRGPVATADVGDATTRLELGDHPVESREPGRHELAGIRRAEEPLGADEQVVVVLVPAGALAGPEPARQRVLVLVHGRGDRHPAHEERRARLVGETGGLGGVEEEGAVPRVVGDVGAGGLGRQPLADVAGVAAGVGGELFGCRRAGVGERSVEAELVAQYDGGGVQDGAQVGEESPGELLDRCGVGRGDGRRTGVGVCVGVGHVGTSSVGRRR